MTDLTTQSKALIGQTLEDRTNFDRFTQAIEQSPSLTQDINALARIKNSEIIFKPQEGPASRRDKPQITLPLEAYQNPDYWEPLITGLGHELGHQKHPRGHRDNTAAATPAESITWLLENEGVALSNEYLVARELREHKISAGDPNATVKTLTENLMLQYDKLLTHHPIASPGYEEAAIQLGASITRDLHSSKFNQLTYAELGEFSWILERVDQVRDIKPHNKINFVKVGFDPNAITTSSFAYETNTRGETVFALKLPIDFVDANDQKVAFEYHSYLGKTDAQGKVVELKHLPDIDFFPEQAIEHYRAQQTVQQSLSPEMQALHEKIGDRLYPQLAAYAVKPHHADAMVATAIRESVNQGIGADEIIHIGIVKDKNQIGVFTEGDKMALFDAITASKNNPTHTLEAAAEQLAQPQEHTQQLPEQVTRSHSGTRMM